MNQVKAGAILNYVIIGLNTLAGLLYTPYMLRCLGQNEYGLYSLVASVIAYLTILDFGFGNAIVRYTAKFRAEGKKQDQWEMFGMFLIVYSIIGVIAFCGGLVLYFNIDYLFDKTMTVYEMSQARIMMILLTLNLAITFPLSIFGSIITAYENFVFQKVINILRIILSTLVMVALLSLGYKAIALVVVQTIFNILTLVLNYFYAKNNLKIKILFRKFNWVFLKEISVYSFWIFLNAIMDKIYWGTGQFVLGSIAGTAAVAIFSVAILLESMFMTFSVSIASVLLPKITTMVTNNMSDKIISDLFIKVGRIQCMVVGLILTGFIVFGKGFIEIWAGKDYSQSYLITLIFFISLFVPLIQNTGITILQARNQMKFRCILYLIISIISLIGQIWLSKMYGPIGCSLAIGIALLIGQGIIMNFYYFIKQGIDIPMFWKQIFPIIGFMIILTFMGIILSNIIDYSNPFALICGIIIFSIVFSCCAWSMMNSYERNLIITPISKMLKKHR